MGSLVRSGDGHLRLRQGLGVRFNVSESDNFVGLFRSFERQ
jgi:hypothetical protein